MDSLDDFSDHSESDGALSNATSVSGLSLYTEEFLNLKQHINQKFPFIKASRNKTPTPQEVTNETDDLKIQLHIVLNENQKLKNDLFNSEKKIELSFHEKINALLRKNSQLEGSLLSANNQIQRLMKYAESNDRFCQNCVDLERKNKQITDQFNKVQSDLAQNSSQSLSLEAELKSLKVQIAEVKTVLDLKAKAVEDLKGSVSKQYVEKQNLVKENLELSNSIQNLKAELCHVKKLEEWYKGKIFEAQEFKKKLQEELVNLRAKIIALNTDLENKNSEINNWKKRYEELEVTCLREKQSLLEKLENVQLPNTPTTKPSCDLNRIVEYYEKTIQELYDELNNIKNIIANSKKAEQKLFKENSDLTSKYLILQKNMQLKELVIEDLENVKKELFSELQIMKKKEKENSIELNNTKKELTSLKVELSGLQHEKELVEKAIKNIREKFVIFKNNYDKLKQDLEMHQKQVLQLENEKQKLFMENNWNLCALQESKLKLQQIESIKLNLTNKERDYIQLTEKLDQMKNDFTLTENQYKEEILNLKQVIKAAENDKENILDCRREEIDKYEKVLLDYKQFSINNANEIRSLQSDLKQSKSKIAELQDNILLLKSEVQNRDRTIAKLQHNVEVTKDNFKAKQEQILIENKKLLRQIEDLNLQFKINSNYSNKQLDALIDNKIVNSNKRKGIIHEKIQILEGKLEEIKTKSTECFNKLESLKNIKTNLTSESNLEELKKLKALIKVKDLEINEKRSRYEVNCRTLLRKVKEHMKGRNEAEKRNNTLQTLHETILEENNSLKLSLSSKSHELEINKKNIESYCNIIKTLKTTINSLENDCKQYENKFIEYEILSKKLEEMQQYLEHLKAVKDSVQNELEIKQKIILDLRQEISDLHAYNKTVQDKNVIVERELIEKEQIFLKKQIDDLEIKLDNEQETVRALNEKLFKEYENYSRTNNEKVLLQVKLSEAETKLELLNKEVELLNCSLHGKFEELKQKEEALNRLKEELDRRTEENEETINKLKLQLRQMQKDMSSINSDRFFMQRLCTDLKFALRSYVNQNNLLKEQLSLLNREKEFISLPNVLPEVSNLPKYDESYINELLQQNKEPMKKKPLLEIQGCLDTLKKEICSLQQQIADKNSKGDSVQ